MYAIRSYYDRIKAFVEQDGGKQGNEDGIGGNNEGSPACADNFKAFEKHDIIGKNSGQAQKDDRKT